MKRPGFGRTEVGEPIVAGAEAGGEEVGLQDGVESGADGGVDDLSVYAVDFHVLCAGGGIEGTGSDVFEGRPRK